MGSSTRGVSNFPPCILSRCRCRAPPSHSFSVVPRRSKRLRLLVGHLAKPSRGKALQAQGHRCKLMGTYCFADMHVCATSGPNITDAGVKLQWISLLLPFAFKRLNRCVLPHNTTVQPCPEKHKGSYLQRDSNRERERERERAKRREAPYTSNHPQSLGLGFSGFRVLGLLGL